MNRSASDAPFLSVIVPCFNAAGTLDRCLTGLLEVEADCDLEVIVVDDGSTDATPQVLDGWAGRFRPDRFRMIRQPNTGEASARNAGIAQARGTYVGFLDSDDALKVAEFRSVVAQTRTIGADLMLFDFERVALDATTIRSQPRTLPTGRVLEGATRIREALYRDMQFYLWTMLFRRQLFANVAFAEADGFCDMRTVPLLARQARTACYLPIAAVRYHETLGSITNTKTEGRLLGYISAAHKPEEFGSDGERWQWLEFRTRVFVYSLYGLFRVDVPRGRRRELYALLTSGFRKHIPGNDVRFFVTYALARGRLWNLVRMLLCLRAPGLVRPALWCVHVWRAAQRRRRGTV